MFHDGAKEFAKEFAKELKKQGIDAGKTEHHTHVHGVVDPQAVAAVVERRQRMRAVA